MKTQCATQMKNAHLISEKVTLRNRLYDMLIEVDMVGLPKGDIDCNVTLRRLALDGSPLSEKECAFLLAKDVPLADFVAERVWRLTNQVTSRKEQRLALAG